MYDHEIRPGRRCKRRHPQDTPEAKERYVIIAAYVEVLKEGGEGKRMYFRPEELVFTQEGE